MYKLAIKDTDIADGGEYTLQIGDRHTQCTVKVQPCKSCCCM